MAGTNIGITKGPLRGLTWGNFIFTPVKDANPEIQTATRKYETDTSGNDNRYTTSEVVTQYIQQDVAMTTEQYNEVNSQLNDGIERAGTATAANGDVISINGAINDDFILSDGVVTLKLAGSITIQ